MIKIKRIDIALTTLCNFNCSYCRGKPGERTKIPYKDVDTIIDNFFELGVTNVRLDGGEPFLYGKEIFNIIDHLTSKGMQAGIFTNASLIDEETAEKLTEYPNVTLYVTLHILNEIHEFESTIKGLKEIAKHNINVELILIVSKKNISKILSSIQKVPDFDYKIIFRPIIPIGRAFENIDQGFASLNESDIKEFKSILSKIENKFEKLKIVDEISKVHSKKDGYHNKDDGFVLHVNTNGELLPSFAAGTSKYLGSALDLEAIRSKLSDDKTYEYLIDADSAVLNRINGAEMPLQASINLNG